MKGSNGCFQRDLRRRQSSAFGPPGFSLGPGWHNMVFTRPNFDGFPSTYVQWFALGLFSMVCTRPIFNYFRSARLGFILPIHSGFHPACFNNFHGYGLNLLSKIYLHIICFLFYLFSLCRGDFQCFSLGIFLSFSLNSLFQIYNII